MPTTAGISTTIASSASEVFGQLGRLLGEISLRAEERAKSTHSRFNVFTTLLREDDEIRLHTRFLHSLLDPFGLHDCGPIFLDLFLKRLPYAEGNPDLRSAIPASDSGWSVKKEAGRNKGFGQIDLLLEHRQFGIAIENKIKAREQPFQLASYASYLRHRHADRCLLIYLTLNGKKSDTHGGASYMMLSYAEHILPWLDDCLRATYSSIPVNQMLLQYRQVVRSLTGKTLEGTLMKPIVDFISATPDLIRHREAWYKAVDDAKALILDRVSDEIAGRLPDDLQVLMEPENDEGRFGTDWGRLYVRTQNNQRLLPEPFELCLENSTDDNELSFGVHAGYDKPPLSADMQRWLERVKAEWSLDPVGAEALENKPNLGWPLGWITLGRIDDDGVAGLIEPGHFAESVTNFVEHIVECVKALRRIASEVDQSHS